MFGFIGWFMFLPFFPGVPFWLLAASGAPDWLTATAAFAGAAAWFYSFNAWNNRRKQRNTLR